MSIQPSEGIGKRLARYRKISGLSARELAEQAGYGLTRGVIANIESGRKTDITVNQLIALSSCLGITPVALALPIDQPYRWLRLSDSESAMRSIRVAAAIDWFQDLDSAWARGRVNESQGAEIATNSVVAIREHHRQIYRILRLKTRVKSGESAASALEEAFEELEAMESRLQRLGIDSTFYKIDDEPGTPFAESMRDGAAAEQSDG